MSKGTLIAASVCCLPFLVLAGCVEPRSTVTELGPAALAEEIRAAFSEPRPLDRMRRLTSALGQLGPENLDEVRAVYDEYLEGLDELELQPFFDAWARFDGPAAFEYAMGVPFPVQAETAREAALYAWAVHDLISAVRAAEQVAEDRPRIALLLYRPVVRAWALSGQDGLQEYILSTSNKGPFILAAVPQIYQRVGADGLLRWSEEFLRRASDDGARMKAFRMTVRAVGFRRPDAAIPWVLDHFGEEYAKEGPRVLVETWLRTDPEAAFEWLRTQAPEQARASALGLAFGTWLIRDRSAARRWIESRPSGDPFYQPAFDTLARRVARNEPKEAIQWCHRGQIGDVDRDCLRGVAVEWYRRDPVAAGLWMEKESGLPVEDRIEVRRRALPKGSRQSVSTPSVEGDQSAALPDT